MQTHESKPEILPLVYISPYYKPDDLSGGNRRFNELCKRFNQEFGEQFTLVISKGMTPPWWDSSKSKLIEIDYNFDHWSKFKAMRQMAKYLDSIPPSTVIIESVPIPYKSLKRHAHFQVAYDFRYFTGASKSFLYRMMFSQYLKRQWRKAQFFVTSTNFSIDELKKYVGYPKEQTIKSYFGIDEKVLDIAKTTPPEKEFDLIYVGHYEKRKNHIPLMHAIAKVDPNLRVFFLGRDTGMLAQLQELKEELGLTNTQITTKSLSDNELWEMYRKSKVFAYPSIYEGFGIPLIEALALDIKVICSDTSVFHEVGGPFPTFFDPYNPDDIAEKLKAALEDTNTPPHEEVRLHLSKFFWDNIYTKFVADLGTFVSKIKQSKTNR